jgi:hypothetical protein
MLQQVQEEITRTAKHGDLLDTENFDIIGNLPLTKSGYLKYISSRKICKIQCGGCQNIFIFSKRLKLML